MSFTAFQERLARSIKVCNLPKGYVQDDILSNFRNAGTIEDLKVGPTELIITYSSAEEKDLSRMYEGCNVGEYTVVLEDPTSFEVAGEDDGKNLTPKKEESEFEIIPEKGHDSPKEEKNNEPVKTETPVSSYEAYKAKETAPVEEPVVKKTVPETRPERAVEETRTERVQERIQERIQEVQESTRTPIKETSSLRVEENSKELLKELQNTNLPARAGLPSNDLFKNVTSRNYLLVFTIIWGLQLFLRSIL